MQQLFIQFINYVWYLLHVSNESHRECGCFFSVCVECCHVEVSATSRSLVQRNRTECGALLCVIKKPSELGGHRPRWAAELEKIINNEACDMFYVVRSVYIRRHSPQHPIYKIHNAFLGIFIAIVTLSTPARAVLIIVKYISYPGIFLYQYSIFLNYIIII
jgi:hypothetical protein